MKCFLGLYEHRKISRSDVITLLNTRSYFQLVCATEIDLVLSFFICVCLCTEADLKTQVLTPHTSPVSVICHTHETSDQSSWSLPGFRQERHSWMDFPVGPGPTFQFWYSWNNQWDFRVTIMIAYHVPVRFLVFLITVPSKHWRGFSFMAQERTFSSVFHLSLRYFS